MAQGEKVGWKVPGRQVYADSFVRWARATFWCHVVLRVFPHAFDFGTQAESDRALRCSHA